MSFPGGDNRTVWQLAFSEQGLDPIIAKASATEKHFDRIVATAVKAGAAIGSFGSSSVLQPMTNAELKTREWSESLKNFHMQLGQSNSLLQVFTGSVASASFNVLSAGIKEAASALADLDEHATKAFGERTSSIRAYTTILGDAKQAQIEYAKANKLASQTEFTSASAQHAQMGLIVAGFRGQEKDKALSAIADITAMSAPEEREAKTSHTSLVFREILSEGVLNKRMLNMIGRDVNLKGVLETIGGGDTAKGRERVHKGEVGAEEGLNAIYSGILKQLGTQKLGQFAVSGAGSMSSMLSNRSEALDILLKSFDGETIPQVLRYKDALSEQTSALQTSSETGKGLVMMLSDFTGITNNVKTIWADFSNSFLETFVDSYNESRKSSESFVAVTDGVRALGNVLGKIGTVVGWVATAFESAMEVFDHVAQNIVQVFSGLGEAYSEFKQGNIKQGMKTFYAAFDSSWHSDAQMRGKSYIEHSRQLAAASEGAASGSDQATKTPFEKLKHKSASHAKGKLAGGYDITSLLMGGSGAGGSGEGSGSSQGLAERMSAAVGAAAAVSSAPSAQAQRDAAASASGASAAPMSVTIAAGAIVVNGVSDPMAAAQEAYRLLGQTLGRVTRAPGAGTL